MKTTFEKIKSFRPCKMGWVKLINYYNPKDLTEEVTIRQVLESNGIKDAVWALRAVEDQNKVRLFCADVAESVLHIFEERYPHDKRPRLAIEASRKFANGEITENELGVARSAAEAAAWISETAAMAARSARSAAEAAARSARSAAEAAARSAAKTAAWISETAAEAAARSARSAAEVTKWKEIEEILLKYLD